MTRKKTNATITEPLLKKGVAVAKKLQEMEEHAYACEILPGAAKFLRKMEELGLLPEDYYMSGLLEWLDDQDSGFTYEEYEKFESLGDLYHGELLDYYKTSNPVRWILTM